MAGRRKGGAHHFTVQEAMNVNLGQIGSVLAEDTGVDYEVPDGKVILCIQPIYGYIAFNTLEAQDNDNWINTVQSATCGGVTNTDTLTSSERFNVPIYGRWTKVRFSTLQYGALLHIGN